MTSSSTSRYRGRFAPSPTGPLHVGSLIAAVGSYLQARSQDGEWLIRMEDIDPPREVSGAADDILRTLESFGFCWDGDIMYQSQRSDAYEAALAQLSEQQLSYPCVCTRKDIEEAGLPGIEGSIYPGTCRDKHFTPGSAHAIRVITTDMPVAFNDYWQGHIEQSLANDTGDFIVKRKDDLYAYQLAVVVDDAEQGITEVVRGSDLLSSTPRQLYLQQLLGLQSPHYAHLPIAVNAARKKLSKQNHAPAVDANNPVPQLIEVLRFLNQPITPELNEAELDNVWKWAIKNWDATRVPQLDAIAVNATN